MISLKSKQELEKMLSGGKIASKILSELKNSCRAGMKTKELNILAEDLIIKHKVKASFKNFQGYPASICVSVNEEVVHGIPGEKEINDGDIVSLDLGIEHLGFHTDTALTFAVGKISKDEEKLIRSTKRALDEGIKKCVAGNFLGDVQNAVQTEIEKNKFGIVKDLVGHGIGKNLQEEPAIPNYSKPKTGIKLENGMVLAIEPMVTLGDFHVKIEDDGWTVSTVDGSVAAHFEHTVAITENGPQILTL